MSLISYLQNPKDCVNGPVSGVWDTQESIQNHHYRSQEDEDQIIEKPRCSNKKYGSMVEVIITNY